MIRLPSWKPQKPSITRPTAEKVNQMQPNKQTITVAGYGDIIPVVYGESEVAGPVIAGPVVRGANLYYAVALSHGPIESIVEAYVGDDKHSVTSPFSGTKVFAKTGYSYRCTFYQGTSTQAPSSILATNITEFADAFKDIAYVVVQASGADAVYGGVHFRIKGRRVLDPQNGVIAYTENAALHMHDFVTNSYFGLGRGMQGINALVEENDRVLAYGPKVRVGHAIQKAGEESSILELLAMYSEALFGFRGGDIYVVPDALIPEEDITDIPHTQIRSGSIRLSSRSSRNIPSSVTITYNTKTVDGLAGPAAYVSVAETNASDPYMNSSLVLMGVYRAGEAERRAGQRLAQLRTPGRVSFQMFDSGLYFNAGDVVRLPNIMGLGGEKLRLISSPEMIAEGICQMTCEVYDAANYTSPLGSRSMPVGAVTFRLDETVPVGMSSLQDLGFLVGKTIGPAQTVGDDDVALPSAKRSIAGGHHKATKPYSGRSRPLSTIGGDQAVRLTSEPQHSHSLRVKNNSTVVNSIWGTTVARPLLAAVEINRIPVGTVFPMASHIQSSDIGKIDAVGLLMAINNAEAGARIGGSITNISNSGSHEHNQYQVRGVGFGSTVQPGQTVQHNDGGPSGSHTHSVEVISNAPALKEAKAELYITKTTEGVIPEGAFLGYLLDGPIPSGWALCDGTNGTVDLSGRFIGFDAEKEGASEIGSVTLTSIRLALSGNHDHKKITRSLYRDAGTTSLDHDPEDGLHRHNIDWVGGNPFPITVTPRYTKIRFIQYIGE